MFDNVFRGKRVLVTGHTGFKGAWLTQWLVELGAKVSGYSVDVPTQPALFDVLGLSAKIDDHRADVRDSLKLTKVFKDFQPEIVFHMAAQPLVRLSYDDPINTFETNVMGTVRVMDAVRQAPSVRVLINVTSDKCYENVERRDGYKETDPMGGKDPYSASKGAAEIVFGAYSRSFFLKPGATQRVGTVRAGNVIGGGDWALDRIVPDCVRAWKKGETVVIRSPESVRPWQHVLEPLSGYLWFAARLWSEQGDKLNGGAFNFGPADTSIRTVKDLIEEMRKSWPESKWQFDPSGIGNKKEAGLLSLNCEKAERELEWTETLGFDQTCQWTAVWYKQWATQRGDLAQLTREQIGQYAELARAKGVAWSQNRV